MKKTLLIDCYDSFSHKLAQSLEDTGYAKVEICFWDKLETVDMDDFDAYVISPGPGLPNEYPNLFEVLRFLEDSSVLGICMGHQVMAMYKGAEVIQLPEVLHGRQKHARILKVHPIFNKIKEPLKVGLYHSWIVSGLPEEADILAETKENHVMAVSYRKSPWLSFQFHPESYMTPQGRVLLKNWLCPD